MHPLIYVSTKFKLTHLVVLETLRASLEFKVIMGLHTVHVKAVNMCPQGKFNCKKTESKLNKKTAKKAVRASELLKTRQCTKYSMAICNNNFGFDKIFMNVKICYYQVHCASMAFVQSLPKPQTDSSWPESY